MAGILGGIVMFLWGFLSHVVLPLGGVGLRSMPPSQEAAVVEAMRGAMSERALYFFPGMDMTRKPTAEEEEAWKAKFRAGPAGIVAYDPRPGEPMSPRQLGTELAANVLAVLLAAVLIMNVAGSAGYGRRVLLVAVIGLITTFDVDVSQWNWYGFPTNYLLAQLVDHVAGWLVAGLVVARVCRG